MFHSRDSPRLLVCDTGMCMEQNEIGFITVAICGGYIGKYPRLITKFWVDYPDDLGQGGISSILVRFNAVCYPDGIWRQLKSPGWLVWLSSWRYLIRIAYGECNMSSGWLKMESYAIRMTWLLVVSRPDLWTMQYAIRLIYDATISYADDIMKFEPYMSSGWLSPSGRLIARQAMTRW